MVWMVGEWRDLKAFPEAWFDWLAVVLSRAELDGLKVCLTVMFL